MYNGIRQNGSSAPTDPQCLLAQVPVGFVCCCLFSRRTCMCVHHHVAAGACHARVPSFRRRPVHPSVRSSAAVVCSARMHALRHLESDCTASGRRTGMVHTPGHHPKRQQSPHHPLWIGPQPLPCMSPAHRQPQHTGTPLLLPHTHFAFCCPCTLRDGAHGHAGVGQNARSPVHSHCVRVRLRLPRLLCCGHAHQAHTHKRSPKHSHFGKCGDPSRSAQPQRPPAAAPTRPWPAPTPGATLSAQPPSGPLRHGPEGRKRGARNF